MALFQLILIGRLNVPGDVNVRQVIEATFIKNQIDATAGAMLVSKNKFVQVLEGEQSLVAAAFVRICSCASFGDVVLVQAHDIVCREFGARPMAVHFVSESILDWESIKMSQITDCICDESEFKRRPARALSLLHSYFDE